MDTLIDSNTSDNSTPNSDNNSPKDPMAVKVSNMAHKKAVQLHKFLSYSSAKPFWGKDQKLLRCNILLVPNSKNYTVLLAMGRHRTKANHKQ